MEQYQNLQVKFTGLLLVGVLTVLTFPSSFALAAQPTEEVKPFLLEAEELLEEFQFLAALNQLEKALQGVPTSPRLHKKRGDVLMILGDNQEALLAYRQALTLAPDFLEGHWALWALLNRLSLDPDLALDSLSQIAGLDNHNPLAQIRVARKLRELQRFEDSVVYFRRAVEIDSTNLVYQLFLARALFDILDTESAQQAVQRVLSQASPGSPVRIAAQNLLQTVEGGTVDMGARTDFFETTKHPYGEKGKDYKRWALTRGQAWQFMEAGNFGEAEATWRDVLTLDPEDDLARYHLGLTLLKLEKYEDAIASLQASFQQSKQPPFFPDAIFQIGQAFAKLKRWEKAIVYYQRVLDIQDLKEQDFYAMNFPYLPRVEAALNEASTHVTEIQEMPIMAEVPRTTFQIESSKEEPSLPISHLNLSQDFSENDQTPLRVRPLSMDVVRGWFRQLVTAKSIVQDDRQAGFHEFIPLDPGDTFAPDQSPIYLVFSLTTPPAGAKQISTQWVAEQVEQESPNTVVGTDTVLVDLNDSSGYFFLDQPEEGWSVGTYRIDLFVGEEISAYTYVADVRFRIQSADPT